MRNESLMLCRKLRLFGAARVLTAALGIVGFVIILSVVGAMDYEAESMHILHSNSWYIMNGAIGTLMLAVGFVLFRYSNYRYHRLNRYFFN